MSIWLCIVIGHIIGDYLLQPVEWAEGKSQPGHRGLIYSLLHAAKGVR